MMPERCGCGKPLLWARTEVRQKWIPLDPKQDPAGNQAAWQDADGTWRTRQLARDEKAWDFERVFMPHVATCTGKHAASPAADAAPIPANVIQFSTLRAKLRKARRP
jgi:hypothetical protein